jgi:hypothetical protein
MRIFYLLTAVEFIIFCFRLSHREIYKLQAFLSGCETLYSVLEEEYPQSLRTGQVCCENSMSYRRGVK